MGLKDKFQAPHPGLERQQCPAKLLPKPLHSKTVEQHLIGNQHHILRPRLGDQEAVERVLVLDVHLAREPGVMEADRQFGEALRRDRFELPCQQRGAVELADAELGRVRRGGADRDLVRLVGNGIASVAAERLVAGQSPD